MKRKLLLLAASVLCIEASAQRIYVKKDATGTGDGSSWTNAYTELGPALTASHTDENITEIWVAEGIYKPTENLVSGSVDDRDKTFAFPVRTTEATGLKLYGGFNGTETLLSERNLKTHKTILSGDLNGNDGVSGSGATLAITNNSDNAYHVVIGYDYGVLDGFEITGGNANGTSGSTAVTINTKSAYRIYGAGFTIYSGSTKMIVQNVVFYANAASGGSDRGGAAYFANAKDISFTNTVFYKNLSRTGGALYANLSSTAASKLTLTNCLFAGNYGTSDTGGAINFNSGGTTSENHITNCTFYGNASSSNGGAISLSAGSKADIKNTIFWDNTASSSSSASIYKSSSAGQPISVSSCIIPSGTFSSNANTEYEDGTIYDGNPLFRNTANFVGADGIWMTNDDGLEVGLGSPAINAGASDVTLPTTDIVGFARAGVFDIGAYEYDVSLPISLSNFVALAKNANAQLSWEVLSALNFNHFEVEKSSDGAHFTKLVNVAFRNLGSYTYTDYMPTMGISSGYIYYRLKLVDNDGSFSYSDVRALKISTLNDNFKVYPSPFKDKISLSFNVDGSAETTAVLYGADGKAITTQKLSNSDLTVNDLGDLSSGVYVLSVTNGANSYKVKVIKK